MSRRALATSVLQCTEPAHHADGGLRRSGAVPGPQTQRPPRSDDNCVRGARSAALKAEAWLYHQAGYPWGQIDRYLLA